MSEKVYKMFYDTEKVIRSVAKPVENPSSPEMKKLLEANCLRFSAIS